MKNPNAPAVKRDTRGGLATMTSNPGEVYAAIFLVGAMVVILGWHYLGCD
jgi:hypothetical protein